MKLTLTLVVVIGSALASFACSSGQPAKPSATPPTNSSSAHAEHSNSADPATGKADEIPAAVRAALSGADSFTVDHKEMTPAQIGAIEKAAGSRITETDHHAYLGFSTAGGPRRQVGAAGLVTVGERKLVVVFENRNGMPTIIAVTSDGLPSPFLAQFVGLGHDNPLEIGKDIKPLGATDAEAKAITDAIRLEVQTMQALYGASHSH